MSHVHPTDDRTVSPIKAPLWVPVQAEASGALSLARRWVRSSLQRLGYDVHRYRQEGESYEARRSRVMKRHGIDLVLDVGANVGEYALNLRRLGYRGRILSFEPLEAAFSQLAARAVGDPSWRCVRTALGEASGEAVIHVAGNSVSSSLLPMAELHEEMFPESAYVGDENVPVAPLQALVADTLMGDGRTLLKLDVQGFELAVLKGSEELLDAVGVIEVEMSTQELYEGQSLWHEVVAFLVERGYQLSIAAEAMVDSRTGRLLQLFGVFDRPRSR